MVTANSSLSTMNSSITSINSSINTLNSERSSDATNLVTLNN